MHYLNRSNKGFWPLAKKEVLNFRLKRIRDLEWSHTEDVLKSYSPGTFLDIGCGSGYAISKAHNLGFSAIGIDRQIGIRGVIASSWVMDSMIETLAEALPFKNDYVDVVYSSHALEHFSDRDLGLSEISRVLNPKGIAVIVVPTGTMAFVNLISQLLFTTHIRIGKFILKDRSLRALREIFLPRAHGSYQSSVIHEMRDFNIRNWKQLISNYFQINEVLSPGLYPYAIYPQFFPYIQSSKFYSSIIFICKKKYMCVRVLDC